MKKYSILSIAFLCSFLANAMELASPVDQSSEQKQELSLVDKMLDITSLKAHEVWQELCEDLPDDGDGKSYLQEIKLDQRAISDLSKYVNRTHRILMIQGLDKQQINYRSILNITELNLSGNFLTTLPYALNQLDNIHSLKLNKNQLEEIPTVIACWKKSLKYLYLDDNKIENFGKIGHESLSAFVKLMRLYLSNNPIKMLPEEEITALYKAKNEVPNSLHIDLSGEFEVSQDFKEIEGIIIGARLKVKNDTSALQTQK